MSDSENPQCPPLLCGHSDEAMRFFSAGEGQEGGGILIFDDLGVHAIPAADTAWREATRGQRNESEKPRASDGSWKLWFLLTRALVLSGDALEAGEMELAPVDLIAVALIRPPITPFEYAAKQLREAALAKHLASQARQHAIIHALAVDDSISIQVVRNERSFIDWFGGMMAERLSVGDFTFIEAVTEFARIVKRMPRDIPTEVSDLCKAITAAAGRIDGVPTKGQVRREMKKINSVYDDEERLRDLRKRAGFQWLPQGKPGPK